MKTENIQPGLPPSGIIAIFMIAGVAFASPAHSQPSRNYFDGISLGVQAGWEERSINETVLPDTLDVPLADKSNGIAYGGIVGYDHQFDNIVVGVEAGFSPDGKTLTAPVLSGGSIQLDSKWSGDISFRLGVTITPRLLAYGRIGYSINRYRIRAYVPGDASPVASGSDTAEGILFGGGLEYAVDKNVSLRAEYRRKEFNGSLASDQILSGVTFRF
ncbi:outer membrane protein [Sphingorhabdus sp. 109]|jgi:outer membrane immunogenic protein|uniref:outer membrane protein n=1 Tax=Sphingorhabdus sp. 109 TaxID=2653173 RepID=UPI0012EF9F09|nr:outer membrane beta-barrel protein [Sphingorhabdus sp. 109]VWX61129.1 Outer membrane protein A [Sphingorhabdus sp. 109]